jgi:O-antigen ligase
MWPQWLNVRAAVLLVGAGLAIAGASGLIEAHAFLLPTTLKYALTVIGPVVIVVAASVPNPLHVFTGLLIIAAPFANATSQLGGTRVSPLVPLLVVGFALVAISEPPRGRSPDLRLTAALAIPLLYLPLSRGSGTHEFVVSLALLIVVGWLVSYSTMDSTGLKVALICVTAQAALQGAIAIWEWHTGHALNLYSSSSTGQNSPVTIYASGNSIRPSGSFNDPISLGNALAISIPLISVLMLSLKGAGNRLLLLAALALSGVGLALSLDRTSWIGAIVGLAVAIAFLPRAARRTAIPYVAAGTAIVIVAALLLAGSTISSRFATIFDPTSTAGETSEQAGAAKGEQNRLQLWSVALDDGFLAHPAAGIGIGNIGQLEREHTSSAGASVKANTAIYANASSTYLQLLAEGGLLAAALFLVLFSGLLSDARAALAAHPIAGAGLAGAVVAVLICWFADVVVFDEPVAACVGVFFGILAGASRQARSA